MSNQNPNNGDAGANRPNVVSIHDHVADLLGAYAVHAVNDAESELVDLHLEHCALCQAELAQHFETAARLGAASVMPVAPRVWDNVLNEIRINTIIGSPAEHTTTARETTPFSSDALLASVPVIDQALASDSAGPTMAASPTVHSTDPQAGPGAPEQSTNLNSVSPGRVRGTRGHSWRVAVAAAVATAAITVPIVSRLTGSSFSLAAVAKRVAAQESSRSLTLKSETGSELAKVVVGQDRQGYLTSDSLPKLTNGKAYQLWAVTTSGPVSLGILGADPGIQAFATPQTYAALAISVEDAAGAAAPTPPIASAAV
jgi:Anti-sigma-K factor rskA